jgi:hypothetical protein
MKKKTRIRKEKLFLTLYDVRLLNDILNYMDKIENNKNIKYPYSKSVYKEFPIDDQFIDIVIKKEFTPTENFDETLLKHEIEEKESSEYQPEIEKETLEYQPEIEKETLENKKEKQPEIEIPKVILKVDELFKKDEKENQSIEFINKIISKITNDKKKYEDIVLYLINFFDPKHKNLSIIKEKLKKYYIIPDYSRTVLFNEINLYLQNNNLLNKIGDIQDTALYKTLYNKYKYSIPIVTLELYDEDPMNYLKKFSLLYILENNNDKLKYYDYLLETFKLKLTKHKFLK